MNKIPVIAVVGPTASGKTKLAVEIAKKFNGEIISADSMQIYKGMSIATAKPTLEEQEGIAHHLIDFLNVDERFSVADYVLKAKECIYSVSSNEKLPIVAGGTGLYIDSLLQNISFCEEKTDETIKQKILNEYETLGGEVLLQRLAEIDLPTAQRLHASDKSRIVRALSLYESTGVTMTEQYENSKKVDSPFNVLYIGINYHDRNVLYNRINNRVDIMMQNGLLDEAKDYFDLDKNTTASQAIGYKELSPYFNGELSLEECIENLKKETRHYAKRQLTWFRRNKEVNWFYPDNYSDLQEFFNETYKTVSNFLGGNGNG